ncbi:hypothetical protein [Ideonella sp.]|uniref:hypothetical protein n=1 Tax=Ideonella sp. TaxID=1929293 RepID=UPI0035B3F7FC
MKRPSLLELIALVGVLIDAPVQASVPLPPAAPAASGASAPSPAKPPRRALTPEELRSSAQFPDGSQPERPIAPQVVIPLGRKAPLAPPEPAASAAAGAAAAPVGSKVNDQVARCKALSAPAQRAACVHAPAASAAPGG